MTWLRSDIPTRIECDELIIRRYERNDAAALVDAVTESVNELSLWMPWAKYEPQTVVQREELIDTWNNEWVQRTNFVMG
ncbi:MAG: hypothetical protein ACK48T_11830, partial [Acidimicrobiaceae bacterium]